MNSSSDITHVFWTRHSEDSFLVFWRVDPEVTVISPEDGVLRYLLILAFVQYATNTHLLLTD